LGSAVIITVDDTELRPVPTMGSVVEMRSVRAILVAVVAAVALSGGVASIAYADDDPPAVVPAAADPQPPVPPIVTDTLGSAIGDPSDPGLPPD
jgi:hypothetical protein